MSALSAALIMAKFHLGHKLKYRYFMARERLIKYLTKILDQGNTIFKIKISK